MRPHDPSFHGRDSRKSTRYLFTINRTCGNVFETARTSLMSLIGYARVSTAEGRQWQASTCLPPSSSTGTPPGWAKRSLGEDMPACPWSPSSCHTSRPSVGPTSCSPANTDGKNAELSLTCHFALFRNRPREQRHSILELDDQFFDFSHRLVLLCYLLTGGHLTGPVSAPIHATTLC